MPTPVRFIDEFDGAIGWIHPEPGWMLRAGHAIRSGGKVWVVDPTGGDGVLERIVSLGVPGGVIQLLDRHDRECGDFADRLGVPHYRLPFGGVVDAPFEVIKVRDLPGWHEAALWFPQEKTLVCADALAAAPGYTARSEEVGVHPMMRVLPPKQLAGFGAERLLLGHGEGIDGPHAQTAIEEAIRTARRNLPAALLDSVKNVVGR
ncbi:MAG: hypothetical protein JHC95_15215 [Solirubrobacteraceae bacterium]|nr:hypothetical protein [Solirubrobacteraceae bacterium]